MSSLRPETGAEEAFSPPEEAAVEWSAPEEKTEEEPEWLSELRPGDEEKLYDTPGAETAPLIAPETPEWLSQLRERRTNEDTVPLGEPEERPETPEFMPDFGATQFAVDSLPPEEAATQPHEEEIPDWLSGLVDTPSDDHPEDLPEWLVSGTLPPDDGVTPALIDEPSDEGFTALPPDTEVKIPDWLSGIMASKTEPVKADQPLEDEMPAWLSGKEKDATPKAEAAEQPESESSETDFEWLEAQGITSPEKTPAGQPPKAVAPFTLDEETAGLEAEELPEWLKEAGVQESQPESAMAGEEEATLSPAALPAWLEAMRPVEAAAPGLPRVEESERSVESSGPLAGLRGILPRRARNCPAEKTLGLYH